VLILGAALIYLCGRRGGFDKAYRKTFHVPPSAAAAARSTDSPAMVEAKYANAGGVGVGVGVLDPKSPGQTTLSGASSTFPGHDNASTLRNSYHAGLGGGQPPYYGPSPHLTTPSPGLPQYGYANGHHHHEGYGGGDYT
jgi:hypothetical protein